MQKAFKYFDCHDFTTQILREAASPIREITYSELNKNNDQIIYTVKSKSFLQHHEIHCWCHQICWRKNGH